MKNRFNLNEEEKNRIRDLHGINILSEQKEDKGEYKPDPNDRSMEINTKTGEKRPVFKKGKVPNYSQEDIKKMEELRKERDKVMFTDPEKEKELSAEIEKIKAKYKTINEDADKDTPGGNPEYFYGDDSLDKLRKFAEEQDSEMSKQDIIDELIAIYSYAQDGSHDLVTSALEGLLYRLGGFRDDISGSNLNEEKNTIKEDGHMDIPSAIRKCKLILDDADDILEKLAELQEMGGELPSWWMDKVTIAADYLNKADDYINTSGKL